MSKLDNFVLCSVSIICHAFSRFVNLKSREKKYYSFMWSILLFHKRRNNLAKILTQKLEIQTYLTQVSCHTVNISMKYNNQYKLIPQMPFQTVVAVVLWMGSVSLFFFFFQLISFWLHDNNNQTTYVHKNSKCNMENWTNDIVSEILQSKSIMVPWYQYLIKL